MLESFIKVDPESHFSIHNLPYGVFRPKRGGSPRIGMAIGDYVLDLSVLDDAGLFRSTSAASRNVFHRSSLNHYMVLGRQAWREVRSEAQRQLSEHDSALRENRRLQEAALHRQSDVELLLPAETGDYTDFYCSKFHALNSGAIFRGKEKALMPNWTHLPVGYHGRASSIVPSGTEIRRPLGQIRPDDSSEPVLGSCRQLDYELEVGYLIGPGNRPGERISVDEAEDHIFGLVLVNDWSARDIQSWESQPLGPFLAKNFATSISPWVVPMDALEPFRTESYEQNPHPLPYLKQSMPGAFDIRLEVHLKGERMEGYQQICTSNFRYLYWSMAQQIAHHTIGGCNLRPGDLLASGTISGPEREARGCLLERTWRGAEPLLLPNGEQRAWLEDGDEIKITGWCQGNGYRVGFGDVTGRILPSSI